MSETTPQSDDQSDDQTDGQTDEQTDDGPGITDDQLPEDLQPGEDNPLAEPLDPDDEATKSRDELDMDATQDDADSGKQPDDSDDEG